MVKNEILEYLVQLPVDRIATLWRARFHDGWVDWSDILDDMFYEILLSMLLHAKQIERADDVQKFEIRFRLKESV